jgi:sterol desaturase/sphingolipid hydroxylase (fatty acid hydroxylase superfamily)
LIHDDDKRTIPMAWWNGPVLVAVGMLPFGLAALLSGQWGILAGATLACGGYYGAYEYMHWCMHLPRKRHLERSGIFFRLNGHHLLHHRYMGKNFNVVLPLADLCLGTLLLRSKIHFKQAEGPSVPNVQPKAPRTPVPAVP